MSQLTPEQRVLAGIAFLDEKMPGWEKRIDLETLDIDHCDQCVLGQILGNFHQHAELGLNYRTPEGANEIASLGFHLYCPEDTGWEKVCKLWPENIAAKLQSQT